MKQSPSGRGLSSALSFARGFTIGSEIQKRHSNGKNRTRGKAMDNEEFEAFWQRFPRRVAKLYALKCFIRARRIASFEDIMDGVARYAKEVGDKDAQYIAHPSSWLNGGRWMDDEGANRSAPVVNPSAQKTFAVRDTDHESKIWRWRLKCLKDSSLWLTSWGPKPGEPHCEVPRHLMEAA